MKEGEVSDSYYSKGLKFDSDAKCQKTVVELSKKFKTNKNSFLE